MKTSEPTIKDPYDNFHENVKEDLPPVPKRIDPIMPLRKNKNTSNVLECQSKQILKRKNKNKMAKASRKKNRHK